MVPHIGNLEFGGVAAFLLLGKSLRIWNETFQRIGGSVA